MTFCHNVVNILLQTIFNLMQDKKDHELHADIYLPRNAFHLSLFGIFIVKNLGIQKGNI